jgi:hypothetical protein
MTGVDVEPGLVVLMTVVEFVTTTVTSGFC